MVWCAHFSCMMRCLTRILTSLSTDEDSLSEEEQGPLVLDQTWRGDPDSEADSVDSDHDDPLK